VVYFDLLLYDKAIAHLEQGLQLSREGDVAIFVAMLSGLLATALIATYQFDAAERVLRSIGSDDLDMRSMSPRTAWMARAELALARGDGALALEIVDQLVAALPARRESTCPPALARLRGEALHRLGRREEAEAVLCAARAAAATQGLSSLVWRLDLQRGRVLRALGRRREADAAFEASRALLDELASGIGDQAIRSDFQEVAARLVPRRRTPTDRQANKARFDGLTRRECDVASLLAAGRSNRQVADALVLSERTVEVYVTNILAKLGFDSRAQIGGWAVQVGLASARPRQSGER
jgi:ATP/maltotriose-dependent transcriptional regulator MalT